MPLLDDGDHVVNQAAVDEDVAIVEEVAEVPSLSELATTPRTRILKFTIIPNNNSRAIRFEVLHISVYCRLNFYLMLNKSTTLQ